MPLSEPVERELFHTRRYEFQGYRRSDGLWDIEGHLVDLKAYGFENQHRGRIDPGEPLHGMWLRVTIDEDFLVHEIEAVTDYSPFAICPAITPNFQKMKGQRIGRGWRQQVRVALGGTQGCTHLVEMLQAMATVAYQTLYPVRARKAKEGDNDRRPGLIDTCHAFASDGEIVKRSWPRFYTGES
jgi:hypothetical protein